MQDLAAQNSCRIMTSSFGSLTKMYSHYPLKNSHNNRLYEPAATKTKDVGEKRFLRKNDVQTVAVRVLKLDGTVLDIIDPRVEINEICYCVLLLPQWVLPGIC